MMVTVIEEYYRSALATVNIKGVDAKKALEMVREKYKTKNSKAIGRNASVLPLVSALFPAVWYISFGEFLTLPFHIFVFPEIPGK